ANVRDSIEEASVSLGVAPLASFFKVVLPLIKPAVWAAALLMWVTSLSELSATIVLYYGGMSTMPIEIFQQVDSGRLALASAYSVILMLAIFVLGAKPSATKEMTRLGNELERAGRSIISLSTGEPDFDTPEHVREAGKAAIDTGKTRYTEVPGTLELAEAICRKFARDNGLEFTTAQITIGVGSKKVLYNALQATVEAGDEVVVPTPAWVSYPEMVKLADGTPVIVRCGADSGFKITPERLEKAITPRTKWL